MNALRRELPGVGPQGAGVGKLTMTAYEHVRREILRRRLPPGTLLNETALAETLGMSKTPVRHALNSLRQEGLLEVGPRRQLLVRNLSQGQHAELAAVREALERVAVSHACRNVSDDDLDDLRTLLRRQRRFAEANDEDAFIECDEEMHITIATRAGLHLVPQILRQLRGFVRLMQMDARRDPGALLRVLEEHVRLVDAIEARDDEAAIAALTHHLHTSEYVIVD